MRKTNANADGPLHYEGPICLAATSAQAASAQEISLLRPTRRCRLAAGRAAARSGGCGTWGSAVLTGLGAVLSIGLSAILSESAQRLLDLLAELLNGRFLTGSSELSLALPAPFAPLAAVPSLSSPCSFDSPTACSCDSPAACSWDSPAGAWALTGSLLLRLTSSLLLRLTSSLLLRLTGSLLLRLTSSLLLRLTFRRTSSQALDLTFRRTSSLDFRRFFLRFRRRTANRPARVCR